MRHGKLSLDFIRNFVCYKVHVVDLERHAEWHRIFDANLDPARIVSDLEILLNSEIVAGQDLLFFDEIQSCPQAIVALRYFYEDMSGLHVIAAGSLMEFALKDISLPVGRVRVLNMHPMNFVEFLTAMGKTRAADNRAGGIVLLVA
ncbi:MAG: AAA family ATPase [bacterium]